MISNNSITKNTFFLYFRMLFSLFISLYTSRVILDVLGIDDYGIYIAVGGIASFMSFVNTALANGTVRYITYALGINDKSLLIRTFSTTLTIHIALGLVIFVLGETLGIWFLKEKMVIAPERMGAALWVFHLSLVTAFFNITQVPYTASINSHEHMSVYAYAVIVESILKLGIVYILVTIDYDKLKVYSLLYFLLTVGMLLFYRFYCNYYFPETYYRPRLYNHSLLKDIGAFSGWNLLTYSAIALSMQGVLFLLNLFFSPAVVSARAISLQISGLIMQFTGNFRTAANPQIIKRYAMHDDVRAKKLLLLTAKYSYYMIWLLALPICLLASPILHVWLKEVPEYTVVFVQFVVIQGLFSTLQNSFNMAFHAKGKLKNTTIISALVLFIQFPIVYFLFKRGFDVIVLSWACLIADFILGVIVQPMLLMTTLNYTKRDLLSVFTPCLRVSIMSVLLPCSIIFIVDVYTLSGFLLTGFVSILSILISIWLLGIDSYTKNQILSYLKNKLIK